MKKNAYFLGALFVLAQIVVLAGCSFDAAPEPVRREPAGASPSTSSPPSSITSRIVRSGARAIVPPTPCIGPRCETLVEIASGRAHTIVLTSRGRVIGWGSGDGAAREVSGVRDAIAIAAGGDRSCAVRSGGALVCWSGAMSSVERVSGIEDAALVAVSDRTTVIALGDGSVRVVRDGGETRAVRGASGIVEVDVAGDVACARSVAEDVVCWRADESDRVTSLGIANVREVAMGEQHQCVRLGSGEVRCWGDDAWGVVGTGAGGIVETPSEVRDVRGALAIAAGEEHTCVLMPGTEVRCWGRNHRGQVDPARRAFDAWWAERVPVDVTGLASVRDVVMVAPGAQHTCAMRARGGVTCWGSNRAGQLGDGSTEMRDAPVDARLRVARGGGTRARVE